MNGIISSMNPYIVLSCLRYLFPSKRLNLKKKEIKKKQREIAIGEQKSKMNFVPFRSVSKEKRKKGGGTEKQRPIKNVNVKRFIRMNSRGMERERRRIEKMEKIRSLLSLEREREREVKQA